MANRYVKDERPKCDENTCISYDHCRCTLLLEALSPCGFFKTKEQENAEIVKSYRRLCDLGYNVHKSFPVLYEQYRKVIGK